MAKEISLEIEELEQRIAPTLFVDPRGVAPEHVNPRINDNGCTHGITPHAEPSSGGVVSCERPH